MFKLIFFCLFISIVHRSSQYSVPDVALKRLVRALDESDLTLDELLAGDSFNDENNEISPLHSIDAGRPIIEPAVSLFHREPDFAFDARQMIEYRGFEFEAHHVVTEDCYVLEMHRIVNPLDRTPNKPPVLLQHGLIDSRFLHCSSAVVSLNLALQ